MVTALVAGLEAAGAEYQDFKLLTTPQLHYVTRCINTKGSPHSYGEPTEEGYYQKVSEAFKIASAGKKFNGSIVVDCANGIGGPKLQQLIKYLPTPDQGGLEIKVVNDDVVQPDRLNFNVCFGPSFPKVTYTKTWRSVVLTLSKPIKELLLPHT